MNEKYSSNKTNVSKLWSPQYDKLKLAKFSGQLALRRFLKKIFKKSLKKYLKKSNNNTVIYRRYRCGVTG